MKFIKDVTKKYLIPCVATTPTQRLFRMLHRCSLAGMNIGGGSAVESSGELAVLRRIARTFSPADRPLVIDAGANVGDWVTCAAQIFPQTSRFHCMEPSPQTAEILAENVRSFPQVNVHPLGVSDSTTMSAFFSPSASSHASLHERFSRTQDLQHVSRQTVSLTRIDHLCEQFGISHIDFLKLDIEGHELAALNGCGKLLTEGLISRIQFEFGGCNIDSRTFFHDFWSLLTEHYRIFRILPHGLWEIRSYAETLEQFITTNYLAEARRTPR